MGLFGSMITWYNIETNIKLKHALCPNDLYRRWVLQELEIYELFKTKIIITRKVFQKYLAKRYIIILMHLHNVELRIALLMMLWSPSTHLTIYYLKHGNRKW